MTTETDFKPLRDSFDWAQECHFIASVTDVKGRIKAMNYCTETFITYCEMQRDAAERAGFHDSATYIQECIDDLKGE